MLGTGASFHSCFCHICTPVCWVREGHTLTACMQTLTACTHCSRPPQAVLQLLLDERTAAASENTALALVHAWLAAQAPGAGE